MGHPGTASDSDSDEEKPTAKKRTLAGPWGRRYNIWLGRISNHFQYPAGYRILKLFDNLIFYIHITRAVNPKSESDPIFGQKTQSVSGLLIF